MARLLVLDDEEGIRESLDFLLSGEGIDVATAATAQEALDIATRFRPQVLIADWALVGESGIDVSKALREAFPGLQTIMITGFSGEDLRAAARNEPFFAIMEKPFDIDDLLAAVRDALKTVSASD